jgi:hypothetical protein
MGDQRAADVRSPGADLQLRQLDRLADHVRAQTAHGLPYAVAPKEQKHVPTVV